MFASQIVEVSVRNQLAPRQGVMAQKQQFKMAEDGKSSESKRGEEHLSSVSKPPPSRVGSVALTLIGFSAWLERWEIRNKSGPYSKNAERAS